MLTEFYINKQLSVKTIENNCREILGLSQDEFGCYTQTSADIPQVYKAWCYISALEGEFLTRLDFSAKPDLLENVDALAFAKRFCKAVDCSGFIPGDSDNIYEGFFITPDTEVLEVYLDADALEEDPPIFRVDWHRSPVGGSPTQSTAHSGVQA